MKERDERTDHIQSLRSRLLQGIVDSMQDACYIVNPADAKAKTAPHILNIAFPPSDGESMDGEMLILNMDMEGICVSSGSACTSGAIEPSHVLLAIGLDRETASAAVRFSIGKDNTEEEIDYTVEKLTSVVDRMRNRVRV